VLRDFGRLIVATAAGAGLGAGAALLRRRSLHAFDHPDGPGEYVVAPSDSAPAIAPHAHVQVAQPDDTPAAPVADVPPPPPAPAPPAPPAAPAAAPIGVSEHDAQMRSEIEALSASVADLEEARNRLRRRAAMLRAEMEGHRPDA